MTSTLMHFSLLNSVEKHLEALREIVLLDHAIAFLEKDRTDEYLQAVNQYKCTQCGK